MSGGVGVVDIGLTLVLVIEHAWFVYEHRGIEVMEEGEEKEK